MRGRLVSKLLDNQYKSAGPHSLIWTGTDLKGRAVSSGKYYITITDKTRLLIGKKIIVLK